MAKEIEKKEEKVSERDALWQEYIAGYKLKNPVKFASKDARGEFAKIPDSFIGKKRVRVLANGQQKVEIY